DAPIRKLTVGERYAAVLSRTLGVAFRFNRPCAKHRTSSPSAPHEHPEDRDGVPLPPPLSDRATDDMTARDLATLAHSQDPLHASIGVAAISSLLDPPTGRIEDGDAADLIADRGRGGTVTLVGHFSFVDRLRTQVQKLHVLELRPQEGDLPASAADDVIPESDVVAITGTTLINHTMEGLLRLAQGRFVVILGPSTVLSPVLFDYGVSAICGSLVTDPEEVLRSLNAGGSLRKNRGVRKLNWLSS
ncbi:MAG: DUF364 domain-containing protein, partial [Deltaproteobacteria bacterium]|nr:DUF364 domain-containing protein [Deltaproteobacteria bacterium]